ncbi:MAG: dihydroorotate dehydrogenase electron transfer subunit [Clostridiales bacterium]|nr:dihydroorotate dehydrogenase electron transfer subunit [Clostridiales bacterium]
MKKEYCAKLIQSKVINNDSSLLTFLCPEIASMANPGQFVNISCSKLLKRPFGVCDVDTTEGSFSIGVREVGEGTKEIRDYPIGQIVDVLGPLGNEFPIKSADKLLLVGGGTGVYPLYFALSKARKASIPTVSVCGFRCADDMCLTDGFNEYSDRFIITTDTGDYGIHGNVLDALNGLEEKDFSGATVLSVGPDVMMKSVSSWAAGKGLSCYVSLERRMACGVGMCLVCTCKIKSPDPLNPYENKRCCADGPIFDATEVIW